MKLAAAFVGKFLETVALEVGVAEGALLVPAAFADLRRGDAFANFSAAAGTFLRGRLVHAVPHLESDIALGAPLLPFGRLIDIRGHGNLLTVPLLS